MRTTFVFALLAGLGSLLVTAPTEVRAGPAALAVHASTGKAAAVGNLTEVKGRKRSHRRARRSFRPYAYWGGRPYYRPYYYYYWQHYYPYGGPLFY